MENSLGPFVIYAATDYIKRNEIVDMLWVPVF